MYYDGMNPKTLTTMVLALLAHNGTITNKQASDLLEDANKAFNSVVLDDLSLAEMVAALDGEVVEQVERSTIEVPDKPKLILPE